MRLACVAALLLSAFSPAHAQNVLASLRGVCTDPSGIGIPGVTLVLRNLDSGYLRTVVSGGGGSFESGHLPLGEYRLEASKPGFRTEVRTGVVLTVGREATVDFPMLVGIVEERVEVAAEAPLVETSNPSLTGFVESGKVAALPLNGRDIVQLIQLQIGVHAARSDSGDVLTGGKGTRITVAGSRPSTNVFMLDGTIINNLGNRVAGGATGSLTGVETIKEFRAYTNSYSAEFSRAAGGAFNIVTKSGTNAVHGSLFEYLRNDNLDARNFFDAAQPAFARNQFGFSLGGPLIRDRTFLFGSYEGHRERVGETIIRTVPDLEARGGLINGASIPIAAAVRPYLALWPEPTSDPVRGDGSALFTTQYSRPVRENFFNLRADHQLSPADSLFVRYTRSASSQDLLNEELFPQFANRLSNQQHYLTIQETRVISPQATNEFRAGFARSAPFERPLQDGLFSELAFIPGESVGLLTIAGFDLFGPDRNTPRRMVQNSFQLSDQVAFTHARHSLAAGAQFERLQYNVLSSSLARGEFRFNSLAEFLRGSASRFDGLLPSARDAYRGYRQSLVGWYLQDALRLTRRLTLHLGVRHEFITVPNEVHGRLNNLRDPLDAAITVGKPFLTQKRNFAPRAGFAFDPRGDGRTAIRGGFGLFHMAFVASQWWNAITRLPPFAITARASGAAAVFPNALAGLNPLGNEAVSGVDYDHPQPYLMHFNLNVQRQLASATVLTVAYVGSRGVNLGREADVNIGAPGNPVRRNANFSRIRFRSWDARSFYNSAQVSLQRSFRGGTQAQFSYTWSKSIDEASSEQGRLEFNNGQARTSNPFNRRGDRGLSSFDIRHNLALNFSWALPWRHRRAGLLLNSWQVNGILSASSGIPFTPIIVADLDRDGTDDNEQRPNLKPGASANPVLGRPEQWFDPSGFESIPLNTRGALGRNTITGPGLASLDLSLVKEFSFSRTERLKLQFRAESFNLLNRANFSTPARSNLEIFSSAGPTAAPLPNVGRITSTSTTARQVQLALRLVF
ncbi:MAG: TonB-dependent receptor [Acidobacteria bacterium]|nr:TonB-dependent receptor [Acidobacteriota bacterium]